MPAPDTAELHRVFGEIDQATEPEQIFGFGTVDTTRTEYRRLALIVHPDKNGGDPRAAEAFRRLGELWQRALRLLEDGSYGKDRAPTVRVRTRAGREYVVGAKVGTTEICDLFDCSYGASLSGGVVFKVARKPADNEFVSGEAATLRRLEAADLMDRWLPFLPEVVDLVGFRAKGGVQRRAVVLRRLDGFVPLERVLAAYPSGIDPRDMAWMWRRLLGVLGAVHESGYVHGAVSPASVWVHPEKHGLVLADWAYAVPVGGRPRAVSRRYRGYYPDELADRRLGREADVFMGARTMLALVCGVHTETRPESMPAPMRAFFRACLLPERMRPSDAWGLQQTFDDLLYRLYGPRKYRPFSMPPS